jgi:hypothetical protein
MSTQVECSKCGIILEGVFFTLTSKSSLASFSQADLESFDITNLAFECCHEDCSVIVCHQCTSKLKREKYRKFLIKREYPICPGCGEQFVVGGSRVLISGRFPPEVSTRRPEYSPKVGKMGFAYVREVKFTGYRGGMGWEESRKHWRAQQGRVFLPRFCSLCMNESAETIQRTKTERPYPGFRRTTTYKYPICKACLALIEHQAIEHPGHPYFANTDGLGTLFSMVFANPVYGDMVGEFEDVISDIP